LQEIKIQDYGREGEIGYLLSIDLYKVEMMLKEEKGEDLSTIIANSDGYCPNERVLHMPYTILYLKLYVSFQCTSMLEISA
jgi:hypothetical protein